MINCGTIADLINDSREVEFLPKNCVVIDRSVFTTFYHQEERFVFCPEYLKKISQEASKFVVAVPGLEARQFGRLINQHLEKVKYIISTPYDSIFEYDYKTRQGWTNSLLDSGVISSEIHEILDSAQKADIHPGTISSIYLATSLAEELYSGSILLVSRKLFFKEEIKTKINESFPSVYCTSPDNCISMIRSIDNPTALKQERFKNNSKYNEYYNAPQTVRKRNRVIDFR